MSESTSAAALSRRRFMGRAAVVGGAAVWGVPMISVLSNSRAFAASGSGSTSPTTPVTVLPTSTSRPNPPTTTAVEGISTSRPAPVGGAGGADPSPSTAVLGESVSKSPGGVLPFTGMNIPLSETLEVGAGLLAAGAVLRTIGARSGTGSHRGAYPAGAAPAPDSSDAPDA